MSIVEARSKAITDIPSVPLAQPLPAHVPPELVHAFPFRRGITSEHTPWYFYDRIIASAPPIFWAPQMAPGIDGWIANRGDAVRRLLADTEHFSNKAKFAIRRFSSRNLMMVPSTADGAEHQVYRGIANQMFTPKRMAAMENDIRAMAREIIMSLRERGECDVVEEFAFVFPIRVFLTLMGLPQEATAQFLAWERQLIRGADVTVVGQVIEAVCDYLEQEIDARRSHPRDDLISHGLTAEFRGHRLNDDELLGYCFNLFLGGLDTVSANTSHHLAHLAQNIDQQRVLRDDPSRIPDAVEEFTRAFAVVIQQRECIKRTELFGQVILPGDKIGLPTAIGNRDPALFDRPDEVILDRKPRYMTFGNGPHLCLGVHLARRELRIAIEEFLANIPEFRIRPGETLVYDLGGVSQPIAVPIVWKP
jgi:cytochrome P450